MSEEVEITFDPTVPTTSTAHVFSPLTKGHVWEWPTTTAFVNADVPSSRSVLSEASIRHIVAEEIEKALPRITSAVLEQMEQRVRLSRGMHKEQAK